MTMKSSVNVKMQGNFYMSRKVDALWREYARAALIHRNAEIGGFIKVERYKQNDWIVTDIEILPQTAASAVFDFEEHAQGEFTHKLVKEGRSAELPYWNGMIHSHPPGCNPFLSGKDEANIKAFANNSAGQVWSVIMTAAKNVQQVEYAVHYFSRKGETEVLFQNIPVLIPEKKVHPKRAEIEEQVKELVKPAYASRPPVGFQPRGNSGWSGNDFRGLGNSPAPRTSDSAWPARGHVADRYAGLTEDEQEELGFGFTLTAPDDEDDGFIMINDGDIVKINLDERSFMQHGGEDLDIVLAMDGNEYEVQETEDERVKVMGIWFSVDEVDLVE